MPSSTVQMYFWNRKPDQEEVILTPHQCSTTNLNRCHGSSDSGGSRSPKDSHPRRRTTSGAVQGRNCPAPDSCSSCIWQKPQSLRTLLQFSLQSFNFTPQGGDCGVRSLQLTANDQRVRTSTRQDGRQKHKHDQRAFLEMFQHKTISIQHTDAQ